MSIAIGVPNGVVNLPTVHMVQTFRGNFVMDNVAFTPVQPANDLYFGTFFFSNSTQNKVKADTTILKSLFDATLTKPSRGYDALATGTKGSFDRTPYSKATNDAGTQIGQQSYALPLFAFDFDGVQGAIKAKGDEKWITYKGMYDNTLVFTSVAGDGYGADGTLDAAEFAYREARGTWRYKMNEEASMASSIPYSGIAGIDGRVSTITDKYDTVLGVTTHKVPHSLGRFKIT